MRTGHRSNCQAREIHAGSRRCMMTWAREPVQSPENCQIRKNSSRMMKYSIPRPPFRSWATVLSSSRPQGIKFHATLFEGIFPFEAKALVCQMGPLAFTLLTFRRDASSKVWLGRSIFGSSSSWPAAPAPPPCFAHSPLLFASPPLPV